MTESVYPLLLTLKQIAEYLQLHQNTIVRLSKKKEIPAIYVGERLRFNKQILDKWFDKKCAK